MATRSNQNNPEQKTKNAYISEFAGELNVIKEAKKANLKKGQPQRAQKNY
ncbi:glycogen biosynthesis protein GlgD [Priestia taiwanensis]|uniref:Uncharacterized protein n=1 Tax=Priestia taiwanensis TaxID=1347902 RepID=A0A917ERW7_9BACI|nr:glycogen biosynthesis protein GlgD [Priestia taiwanensis]MBM7363352.1 hypothetical protein [Priestia taiwanensis]GGE77859.1 hypothetical protein GCM10007140_29400 [Priestia taiwanensis]